MRRGLGHRRRRGDLGLPGRWKRGGVHAARSAVRPRNPRPPPRGPLQVQPRPPLAQHHNGIFRTTNDSASWEEIKDVPPSSFGFAVAVHPDDPGSAWFVPGIKDEKRIPVDGRLVVTRTRNGGQSFDVLGRGSRNDTPMTSFIATLSTSTDAATRSRSARRPGRSGSRTTRATTGGPSRAPAAGVLRPVRGLEPFPIELRTRGTVGPAVPAANSLRSGRYGKTRPAQPAPRL